MSGDNDAFDAYFASNEGYGGREPDFGTWKFFAKRDFLAGRHSITATPEKVQSDSDWKRDLIIAIGYEPIMASWTDSEGAHAIVTHMAAKDRDRIVDAVLPLLAAATTRSNGNIQ